MLNKITEQIHNQLRKQAKTISVAESCTGGLLSSSLTSLSGSSDYFILGVVTYSNKSKEMILNIPAKTIAQAAEIRRRVMEAFENAERTQDLAEKRKLLTFVLVGVTLYNYGFKLDFEQLALKTTSCSSSCTGFKKYAMSRRYILASVASSEAFNVLVPFSIDESV